MYINNMKGGTKAIICRDKNQRKVSVYIHVCKYQYNID